MVRISADPVIPNTQESALAQDSSRQLSHFIGRERLEMLVPSEGDGKSSVDQKVVLPNVAVRLLVQVLTILSQGQAVTIMPVHAELTTQEAADLLNVSRPYLIGLLDKGELPHHKVGTHRRVKFSDLIDYKRRTDAIGDDAMDELVAESQELGLYK